MRSLQKQFRKVAKQMYNGTLQQTITYQGKKGESDFQSYHITIFKMSIFQKNKTYKTGKYAVFIGKKKK